MANFTTREFWAASTERAVKTAAQTAIALIGTDQAGILNLDWAQIGSVVATAVVLSMLTSIAGDATSKNGPSFVRSEGIGVENAEAEEALRRERTGELIDTSTAVSFATDASEGDDDPIEDEEEPEDTDYLDAPAEVDDTYDGDQPRH